MGQPKLLLPWGKQTLVEHILQQWLASSVDAVVVVVAPDQTELAQRLSLWPIHLIQAPQVPQEMKHSVLWGLKYLQKRFSPGPHDAWLLSPCDIPNIRPQVIDRLMHYYRPGLGEAVLPLFGTRRGHPILLPWQVAEEVGHLGPQEGINRLVHRLPWCVVPQPEPFPQDLDTPEQYRRMQARF